MPLAAELDLTSFDHTDASLRGERYRRAMSELHGHAATLALDGDPQFGTPSGIYGLEKLPLKLEREE